MISPQDLSSVPNRKVGTVLLLRHTSFSVNQSTFSLASLTHLLENNWEDTGLSSHILRDGHTGDRDNIS